VKHLKTEHPNWLNLTGLSFGLALLTKYPAILVLPLLGVFELYYSKLRNLRKLVTIFLIGIGIFSIYPLVAYLSSNPHFFTNTLNWGEVALRERALPSTGIFLFTLMKITQHLFEYGTPILALAFILSLRDQKKREEFILYSWITIYLLFYMFVITSGAMYRYLMVLLPPLALFSSSVIVNSRIGRKDMRNLLFSSVGFLAIIIVLNIVGVSKTRLSNYNIDIELILQNPQLWLGSNSGPNFAISIYSFLFVFTLGLLLCILYLAFNDRNLLVALIALSFSYNLVLLHELYLPYFVPDHDSVISQLSGYYIKNQDKLPSPIYSIDEEVPFYIGLTEYIDLQTRNIRDIIRREGGTVLLLNTPPAPRKKALIDSMNNCKQIKTFYSKGYETAYVFVCEGI
jgi:4-amino-4-deoxy-L-arabinose transferase-like glycosyltransferase